MEDALRQETEKWLARIKDEREKVSGREDFLKNIDCYISDSEHFLEKNDLIRAFEAVIWAYAWLEIGRELGMINSSPKTAGSS